MAENVAQKNNLGLVLGVGLLIVFAGVVRSQFTEPVTISSPSPTPIASVLPTSTPTIRPVVYTPFPTVSPKPSASPAKIVCENATCGSFEPTSGTCADYVCCNTGSGNKTLRREECSKIQAEAEAKKTEERKKYYDDLLKIQQEDAEQLRKDREEQQRINAELHAANAQAEADSAQRQLEYSKQLNGARYLTCVDQAKSWYVTQINKLGGAADSSFALDLERTKDIKLNECDVTYMPR